MTKAWKSGLMGLMIFLCIGIALHAVGFQLRISGGPDFHARFDDLFVPGTMHVVGGAIVLLLGGFQFLSSLRERWPKLHRWAGRIYLLFVLIGGIGGLLMAPHSSGGLVAHFGFGLLAVLWLFSGWQAYSHIRAGDIRAHRDWMLRNFSMTFGAVTLRLYLGLFALAGVPFEDAYPVTAWLSWVLNLIVVEWYLVLAGHSGRQAHSAPPHALPH